MAKRRVIIDYSSLADTRLDQKADEVLAEMTDNPSFATPVPPLTELETARDSYRAALINAAGGGTLAIQLKDQERAALLAVLRKLAQYVQLTADDDEAVAVSSGFTLSRIGSGGPLPKPANLRVSAFARGMARVAFAKVRGARTYQYEYRPAGGDAPWATVLHTRSRLLIEQLTSGTEYEFRVLPIGVSEVREYSDTVTSFIL